MDHATWGEWRPPANRFREELDELLEAPHQSVKAGGGTRPRLFGSAKPASRIESDALVYDEGLLKTLALESGVDTAAVEAVLNALITQVNTHLGVTSSK